MNPKQDEVDASAGIYNTDAGTANLGETILAQLQQQREAKEARRREKRGEAPRSETKPVPKKPASQFAGKFKLPSILTQTNRKMRSVEEEERDRAAAAEFVSQAGPVVEDAVRELLDIESSSQRAELWAERRQELIDGLIGILNNPEPVRTEITIVYAKAMADQTKALRGAVVATRDRLVRAGFIRRLNQNERVPDAVKIYDGWYVPVGGFNKNPKTKAVMTALRALVGRSVAEGREYYNSRMGELYAQAGDQIPVNALICALVGNPIGVEGRAVMEIPDTTYEKNGETRSSRGGVLLVEVFVEEGQEWIKVVDAVGSFERRAREVAERASGCPVSQLSQERVNLGSNRLPPDHYRDILAIHGWVRPGLIEAARKAAKEGRVAQARAKATVSLVDLVIEGTPGLAFFDWSDLSSKPFIQKFKGKDGRLQTRRYEELRFFVERDERGQIRAVVADELGNGETMKAFFGGCQDWQQPGERFQDLHSPLRPLLKLAYGILTSHDEEGVDE